MSSQWSDALGVIYLLCGPSRSIMFAPWHRIMYSSRQQRYSRLSRGIASACSSCRSHCGRTVPSAQIGSPCSGGRPRTLLRWSVWLVGCVCREMWLERRLMFLCSFMAPSSPCGGAGISRDRRPSCGRPPRLGLLFMQASLATPAATLTSADAPPRQPLATSCMAHVQSATSIGLALPAAPFPELALLGIAPPPPGRKL